MPCMLFSQFKCLTEEPLQIPTFSVSMHFALFLCEKLIIFHSIRRAKFSCKLYAKFSVSFEYKQELLSNIYSSLFFSNGCIAHSFVLHSKFVTQFYIFHAFIHFHPVYFSSHEGCRGSRPMRSWKTSQFSVTFDTSAVSTPRWCQVVSEMYSRHLLLSWLLLHILVFVTSCTYLANSWGILVMWPNHRRWDLSVKRSSSTNMQGFTNSRSAHFV